MRLAAQEPERLSLVGEAAFLLLGEDEATVGDDVELALLALGDEGVNARLGQLGRDTRGSYVVPASDRAVVDLDLHAGTVAPASGRWRSTIRSRSSPRGSVPKARPPPPASRVEQNASAATGSPWRSRSDA